MVSTTTHIGEEEATHAEDLVAATWSTPHTVQGPAVLQLSDGSAATTVILQRHPATANNRSTPPDTGSAHWVEVDNPTVDAAAGALVNFNEPGVAWYRYQVDLPCSTFLSAKEQ